MLLPLHPWLPRHFQGRAFQVNTWHFHACVTRKSGQKSVRDKGLFKEYLELMISLSFSPFTYSSNTHKLTFLVKTFISYWIRVMCQLSQMYHFKQSNSKFHIQNIVTCLSNLSGWLAAFIPTSRAMVEPQLPEPSMETFFGAICEEGGGWKILYIEINCQGPKKLYLLKIKIVSPKLKI